MIEILLTFLEMLVSVKQGSEGLTVRAFSRVSLLIGDLEGFSKGMANGQSYTVN